ncbi:hypothetical protein ACJ51O_36305 (plasmid) [Burkholderia pyrrocinia]|uniref:hypothetical protein n=1 Tax=Burkholderia pyrrocinia TaxID=60550 RepID=UPI0038B50585
MSTVFTVRCESGEKDVTLSIVHSLNPLPGSDTWSTTDTDAWGLSDGAVANWGSADLSLHGDGASPVAILFKFTKSVSKGDKGDGEKQYADGSFPTGRFVWTCMDKR